MIRLIQQTGVRLAFQPSYSIFDVYDCTWAVRLRSGNWMLGDKRRGHRATITSDGHDFPKTFPRIFPDLFPFPFLLLSCLFCFGSMANPCLYIRRKFGLASDFKEMKFLTMKYIIDRLELNTFRNYIWRKFYTFSMHFESNSQIYSPLRFLISRSMIF